VLPSQLKVYYLVDCRDTVKYQIPGYFLNTEYWDEKYPTIRKEHQQVQAVSTGSSSKHKQQLLFVFVASISALEH